MFEAKRRAVSVPVVIAKKEKYMHVCIAYILLWKHTHFQEVKGLKAEIIKREDYSLLFIIEVRSDLKHTVLYYGHYDKQPLFTGCW